MLETPAILRNPWRSTGFYERQSMPPLELDVVNLCGTLASRTMVESIQGEGSKSLALKKNWVYATVRDLVRYLNRSPCVGHNIYWQEPLKDGSLPSWGKMKWLCDLLSHGLQLGKIQSLPSQGLQSGEGPK